jgi:hypothetical protein
LHNTPAKIDRNAEDGIVVRAINAGPIEKVRVANSIEPRRKKNGPIVRNVATADRHAGEMIVAIKIDIITTTVRDHRLRTASPARTSRCRPLR